MSRMLTPTKLLEMEPIIVEKLIKAKGKNAIKQVANDLKIDQDFVRHIYNSRKIGQKRQELEKQNNVTNVADIIIQSAPLSYAEPIDVNTLLPSQELIDNMTDDNKLSHTEVVKGDGYFIDEDVKLSVVLDYESGEYTYSELSSKYKISSSSVYRIVKELGNGGRKVTKKKRNISKRNPGSKGRSVNNHQRRKSIKELEQEYVTIAKSEEETLSTIDRENETSKILENADRIAGSKMCIVNTVVSEPVKTILSTSYKLEEIKEVATKVGLCADRHEMNVDVFIYNTLTEDEMFNYSKLYNRAVEFIEKNVPSKILHLYCTGIQCALAAVIKACHDNNVTLSLFHYNAHNGTYMRQDMWRYSENFIDETVASFSDIMRKGPVFTFGGKINPEEFYTISVNQVRDNSDGFISQAYVCCDNMENAFKLYLDYIKDIDKDRDRVKKAVFITKCKVEKGRFVWDVNLSKSFNFK